MSDRPILMSAPMVRALLDGRKTQTRRLAWDLRLMHSHRKDRWFPKSKQTIATPWQSVEPGDRLWVRENHAFVGGGDPGLMLCEADWRETAEKLGCENIPDKHPRWTPCIHMFKKHSRITLVVTATKMERVQEISEDDAVAESCKAHGRGLCTENPDDYFGCYSAKTDFGNLWQSLHTKPGARWENNPEVVALTFDVHKRNIDTMEKVA